MPEITYIDEESEEPAIVDAELVAPAGQPCVTCRAPVETNDQFCGHCGEANAATQALVITEESAGLVKHFQCEGCGAKMTADPDQRSYTCPFCDSTYVVEFDDVMTDRQDPEFIIGFAVTPDKAQEMFQSWLGEGGMFRPGDLKQAKINEKLRGIYLPFWRFTMLAQSQWSAQIGEYWYRTETYTTTDSKGKTVTRTRRVRETEWWPLSGNHHKYHRDYLVSGSQGLNQGDADRIMPFNLPALKRYQPYYLAGWLSEEYSIDRAKAMGICRQRFQQWEEAAIKTFLPGDTSRSLQARTKFSRETSDLCLLPVYLLSYRYGEKVYRFMVNGQTGRIAGDKPYSSKRIWAAVLTGIAVVVVLVLLLMLLFGAFAANA